MIYKLFAPCKAYIWGGTKLKEKYGKTTDADVCAESWELSFHKDGLTTVAGGKTLAETLTKEELGTHVQTFPFFPTLNKFIDAKSNLSVQVHPSDEYALKHENSLGKTEMWYVVEAEEGAGLYLGFNRDVTKQEFQTAIEENRLTELLNFYPVKAGDCYFIPAGTIHAICKGCLIYEIQQNSNVTYRVYDYGRTDKDGNPRELHVEKALQVTNLQKFIPQSFDNGLLGKSEYFTVDKADVNGELVLKTNGESFACITCVGGKGSIDGQPMAQGDSFFVGANHGEYVLQGDMQCIRTRVEK